MESENADESSIMYACVFGAVFDDAACVCLMIARMRLRLRRTRKLAIILQYCNVNNFRDGHKVSFKFRAELRAQ